MIDSLLYPLLEWLSLVGVELLVIIIALFSVIAIRHSYKSKLDNLVLDTPLATLAIDVKNGDFLLVNPPAMRLLGIRLVGKKFILPSTIAQQDVHAFLCQISSWKFKDYLLTWSTSEFQTFRIEITGRKIRYRNRSVWLLYVVKHVEAQLDREQVRTSLKVARSALDSLSELIYIQDNDGNLLDSNKSFNNFWSGREEESDSIIDGVMQGRRSQRRWTTDPQGRSCLLETSQTSLLSSEGDILGLLNISHDVTDWFKMQQDLRDEMEKRKGTEIALAQRDTILQSILASSPDVIALFNENRVYDACNQAYVDSLDIEFTPEQLIGKKIETVLPNHLKKRFVETDNLVLERGETLRYVDEILDKNGQPKWYDVVKSPYKDPSTGIKGVLLLARDVTERYLAKQQLEEMNQELAKLSFLDGLTQVANRRRFDEQLNTVWSLHRRQKNALTVILCDLDFFKDYNDNYGHLKGDQALVAVATAFNNILTRASDCVARYGGEEFAFILPNTDYQGAQIIASNIHKAVKDLQLPHSFSGVSDLLTVSIGVASLVPPFNASSDIILSQADDALYLAKKQGRNQTQYFNQ